MTRVELIAQAEALIRLIADVETRPILYTDSLRGRQVRRDDLWAVTTEQLVELRQLVQPLHAQAAAADPQESEPVAYLITWNSGTQKASLDPCHPDDGTYKPLYRHPDPRVAELEGLLLECAEGYSKWMRDNGYQTQLLKRIRAALKGGE